MNTESFSRFGNQNFTESSIPYIRLGWIMLFQYGVWWNSSKFQINGITKQNQKMFSSFCRGLLQN